MLSPVCKLKFNLLLGTTVYSTGSDDFGCRPSNVSLSKTQVTHLDSAGVILSYAVLSSDWGCSLKADIAPGRMQ